MTGPSDDRDGPGRVTVYDVARHAGVSIATVSRVVNGTGPVAAARRDAVLEAMRVLDFVPNPFARSLMSRRSRAVGLVVPTIVNPVFAPTISAIERVVADAGYALLIHSCERDPRRELEQVRALVDRNVDGLILTGSQHHPDLAETLARRGIPFVSQDVAVDVPLGPSLALPNEAAMATAVDHLHALGHRAVAVISGPTHNTPPIRDRLDGALKRLAEFGIAPPPGWIVEAEDYGSLAGRRAASRLLDEPEHPTAIVCTGDILALAVVAECRRHGLTVPSDVSIVGCGDTEMGHYVDPPLTTVHMPFAEMGTEAATLLLGLLAGTPAETALRILRHELVERSSVARRDGADG